MQNKLKEALQDLYNANVTFFDSMNNGVHRPENSRKLNLAMDKAAKILEISI